MIDIRRVRTDPDGVASALARRGIDAAEIVGRLAELDARQRAVASESERLRAEVKRISKDVGAARRDGDVDKADRLAAESRALGEEQAAREAELTALADELRDALLRVPNLPADDAPDGAGERDNVVLRVEGYEPEAYGDHQRVPHWEIGAELGILDLERATKLSGSMFTMYRGHGARLLRALTSYALDQHTDAYEEIRPPTFVKTETMVSTGHLPKFAEDAYHMERDDLWAIPTAEVPLTSLGRDEILDEASLPMRFTAYTPCFRREAGSAGRDTRGLLRNHEFDKVELLAYATAAQAADVHADMLERAERLLRDLGLAYRVVDLCTGDIGNSAARTFDLDAYSPGCDMWLEVSSVSWFSDYQARRANIRYRPAGGKGTEVVHTLNGSALGWGRVWAAVVETHRRPDGTIGVPEVLRPYMGGLEVIGRV